MEGVVTPELEQGREYYDRRAWSQALAAFVTADRAADLGAEDLERLATSAYLIGRDDDYLDALERAHHAYLNTGETLRSVRCAFWLGLRLLFRGDTGRANGWFARAERLTASATGECVESGYLLLPVAQQHLEAGDWKRSHSIATAAVDIAERFDDPDLLACARHLQGRALLQPGQIARGLALLDETMLAVTAGKLSSVVTGLIYCSVIDACQRVCAAGRAREWTLALSRWCEQQPEMVSFTGACLAHRAEIMQLSGAWHEAITEARRACERSSKVANQRTAAAAFYQAGEVHRLRGEFAAAEDAYRQASECGSDPQPGLALLRLAQGRTDVAVSTIRRVAGAAVDDLERVKVLPAFVDIMLAVGDVPAARHACKDLEGIAAAFDVEVMSAMAAQARGAVELAEGDAFAALGSLRRASQAWQQIEAPYLAARTRVSIALACRALGDEEATAMELDAAAGVFERLEASPDLAHVDSTRRQPHAARADSCGLTRRQLEVLRLVATGRTNRQIAGELVLSEKTIERHVSNIFAKLSVPSRAAATAYAYRHQLLGLF
jgi:DNA-binding NarL/FixJ family response regulator